MAETIADSTSAAPAGEPSAAATVERKHLGIRLQAVNQSEQPIFSNVASVQGTPGTVFVDFGFIDPGALQTVARLAQTGGTLPETIDGRLVCRMALGLDTARQLAQELDQCFRSMRERARQAAMSPPASGGPGRNGGER
jgi:hypothetical protein